MRLRRTAFLASLILLATAPAARADLLVTIDKDAQSMSVAVDGQTRRIWPVSTGAAGYDTPNGSHRPFRMEASRFSRELTAVQSAPVAGSKARPPGWRRRSWSSVG